MKGYKYMDGIMPYVWLIVIVVMCVIEAITVQLVSIWFVIGAVFALIVSLVTDSITAQVAVFVLVALITLVATRPFIKRMLNFKKEDTNSGRYIGKVGVVISEVNNNLGKGQVNVLGNVWTAKSYDGSIIEEGMDVVVMSIEGVKLIVSKKDK